MTKITRENICDHLIEYQLAYVNKSLQDAIDTPDWFREWHLTPEQYEEFKAYAIPLLKKVFKCNTNKAKNTFEWFDLKFGLTVKEEETNKP